jgi:diacylglycerol kinase
MAKFTMQNIDLESQELKLKRQSIISETQSQTVQAYLRAATLWKSFGFALAGIRHVIYSQRNAKIHAGITGLVILLGLFLRVSTTQWAILALAMGLVFSAEMFNTVIEALVDLVSPNFHPQAKVAKDVAAGAVLLLAIMSISIGVFIFGPPLWRLGLALIF